MHNRRAWSSLVSITAGVVLLCSTNGAAAAEDGPYSLQNIQSTLGSLKWECMLSVLCPVGDTVLDLIKKAAANDRSSQYLLGLTLLTGDGLPSDRQAGVAWIALAAERGDPDAARDIQDRIRNGASIAVNETKVVAALKAQADAGDAESMRALGPMYIGGRGVQQDAAIGLGLMRRAVEQGSSGAEIDLAQLYLNGAPGVPADRTEALKWFASSAHHGNVQAMVHLGYLSLNAPGREKDLAAGYCWLMRAALLDQVQAQDKLSLLLASGDKDERGTVVQPDLVQADFWFRLAAHNPFHDNSQVRAMIEPQMTTEQLNQAKQQLEAWRPRTLPELKTTTLPLPPPTQGNCPAT